MSEISGEFFKEKRVDFAYMRLEKLEDLFQNDEIKGLLDAISKQKDDASADTNVRNSKIISAPVQNLLNKYGTSMNKKTTPGFSKANSFKIETVAGINLGYNQLRDLETLVSFTMQLSLPNLGQIQWLDLQHNYLSHVPSCLKQFTNLNLLYLQGNYIADLNNFLHLTSLDNLRNITIHSNPLVRIPNFRFYVISILPQLKKIDSVLITIKDRIDVSVLIKPSSTGKLPVYTYEYCPKPPPLEINE